MRLNTLLIIGAIGLAWTSDPIKVEQMANEIEVSFLASPTLTLHEPIIVKCSIRSGYPEPVTLDLGFDRKEHFRIKVTNPTPTTMEMSLLRASDGGTSAGRIGFLSLEPGQTYSDRFLLNEVYDFDQVGTYEIEIYLETPVQAQSGALFNLTKGGAVRIQVLPRNEEVLRQKCGALLAQVLQGSSAQEQIDGARALSSIKDDVSISFIQEVISQRESAMNGRAAIALQGLRGIGSKAAIEALIASVNEHDGFVHECATGQLRLLEPSIRDPITLERVKAAIR